MPGCVLSAAAPVPVPVLVAVVSPLLAFPVTFALAEVTVIGCATALEDWPKVHVKVLPLTGVETTPPLLDRVWVPFDGILLGA
jgi:hypothetical protein